MQEFRYNLEINLLQIHKKLISKKYIPDPYKPFCIQDPKKRLIHKAEVSDRVVHQAIINIIEPIFDKSFINDSFSCRKGKGTHKAVKRFKYFLQKVSKNNTQQTWILKCDVKRFFDSINHDILKELLHKKIECSETINLLNIIIDSFEKSENTGLPLGNLTSQFFGNIYLHELDFFIKHSLKVKYYLRYCDDMILVSNSKIELQSWLKTITEFLYKNLKLEIHPSKIFFRKYTQGMDFLGYITFPNYTILRKSTKQRIIKKWSGLNNDQKNSYYGVLKYSKSFKIKKILNKEETNI